MKPLPKIVAAGGTALLLLAGCGGSFIPGTVAQNSATTSALSSPRDSAAYVPSSVGPHPTTVSAETPAPTPSPTAAPAQTKTQAAKANSGPHRTKLSVGPHPTHGVEESSGGAAPTPSPSPT